MGALRDVILNILGPILLMVLLGAILRWKFRLDVTTLSKLNIYLFVPAFIFDKVTASSLYWQEMVGVVGVTVGHTLLLGVLVWTIGKAVRLHYKTLAAILLAIMFYNSGNYGLPLAELAFPGNDGGKDGGAVQAFVLMAQNIMTFTVGLMIAAWAGSGSIGKGIVTLFRLPIVPALAAALLTRYLTGGEHARIPRLVAESARYLGNGLVPIALVTLGAQLASRPRWPRWGPVSAVVLGRLLYGPVQMACVLWGLSWAGMHLAGGAQSSLVKAVSLWPWPGELLILTAGTPTAVNTLLLTLELDGDADLAADCVFWTTVCSCVTLTGWLLVIRPG